MTRETIMNVIKPAICARLRCPATAQFSDNLISVIGDDENGYMVQGFVDSQNVYGALVRTDFVVNVVAQNGFPVVTSVSVGANANANIAARIKKGRQAKLISSIVIIAVALFLGVFFVTSILNFISLV